METVGETPRPVLVNRKTRRKKQGDQPKSTPESPASQEPSAEILSAIPADFIEGAPDHSLVPIPPKKLLEPAEFFRFWKSIPKRERDAWFIAYPYRKLPVLDVLQPLTVDELRAIERHQKKRPDTNCGKLTEPFDPDNWEQDVYQWRGAGDYQIRLNDNHPSVKGTVCETHIRGLREWDRFPPIINNLAEVVLEEPLNQPYLRWARLHGLKFPGDPGTPENPEVQTEEEDDMANVSAVVESNRQLTDRVIEMSKEVGKAPAPVAPAPTEVAGARGVEVMADAAKKSNEMIMDAIKASHSAQAKAQDPAEHTRSVIEMAKVIAQPAAVSSGPTLTEIVALMTTMMAPITAGNTAILAEVRARAEAAERRAEAAEARANAIAHPPAVAPVAPESPVKTALELIKGLATLRDAAAPILGGGGDSTDGMPTWAKLVDKGLDALPGVVHNLTVLKTGQGNAVPPPDLEVTDDEPEQPAEATPKLNTKEENTTFSNRKIAEALAAPLIESLNRGDRGFQFAAGMILQPSIMGFPGAAVYEMALSKGKDGMYQILQSYPELWQKLIQIPKKFDVYLDDFLNADMARAIAAESRKPQPPQPPAPGPAVEVTPEVLPKANGAPPQPKGGGRTIIGTTGQPIQTAP